MTASQEAPSVASARAVGLWSGLAAFGATVAYVFVQVLQIVGVVGRPLDEILIYGTSLAIVFPFLLEMIAVHQATPSEKRIWSHAAVLFATIYAVFASANYVVQLGTVIPMSLAGESAEVRVLAQTPHSLLWNFDALAYVFMAVAMLAAIPAHFSPNLVLVALPWAITAPAAMLAIALWLGRRVDGHDSRKRARSAS